MRSANTARECDALLVPTGRALLFLRMIGLMSAGRGTLDCGSICRWCQPHQEPEHVARRPLRRGTQVLELLAILLREPHTYHFGTMHLSRHVGPFGVSPVTVVLHLLAPQATCSARAGGKSWRPSAASFPQAWRGSRR